MTPEDITLIRQVLPDETTFPYYPDRESPWLLARGMRASERVSALKSGPRAGLLQRPLIRPLVAGSGGTLRQTDVLAVAHADRALRWPQTGAGARSALESVFCGSWRDYLVSFAAWGVDRHPAGVQMSRAGGNLVLQLGFPSDHAVIVGQLFRKLARSDYECTLHPVRITGRPTLAWVRLDIDLATGTALIEEVQSDWLRYVEDEAAYLTHSAPQSRDAKVLKRYSAGLARAYARDWPRVALLASLMLLGDDLGIRQVWMHQPAAGAVLKSIGGSHPPRSLYTALPKRFGFLPVRDLPPFLERPARRKLKEIAHFKSPLFWRLDL